MGKLLLNLQEAAERLGITPRRLTGLAKSGRISYVPVGRSMLFEECDLTEFIAAVKTTGAVQWDADKRDHALSGKNGRAYITSPTIPMGAAAHAAQALQIAQRLKNSSRNGCSGIQGQNVLKSRAR